MLSCELVVVKKESPALLPTRERSKKYDSTDPSKVTTTWRHVPSQSALNGEYREA
jgi:hypothetical protein